MVPPSTAGEPQLPTLENRRMDIPYAVPAVEQIAGAVQMSPDRDPQNGAASLHLATGAHKDGEDEVDEIADLWDYGAPPRATPCWSDDGDEDENAALLMRDMLPRKTKPRKSALSCFARYIKHPVVRSSAAVRPRSRDPQPRSGACSGDRGYGASDDDGESESDEGDADGQRARQGTSSARPEDDDWKKLPANVSHQTHLGQAQEDPGVALLRSKRDKLASIQQKLSTSKPETGGERWHPKQEHTKQDRWQAGKEGPSPACAPLSPSAIPTATAAQSPTSGAPGPAVHEKPVKRVKVEITIASSDQRPKGVRMYTDEAFKTLFDKYALLFGNTPADYWFTFDGVVIEADSTPELLGMEYGDQIEVHRAK